jgi:hypothetical protein
MNRDCELGPQLGGYGYGLLQHVINLQPEGTAVEFGVGVGNSTRIIAKHMPVVGFDSFQGLPEQWCEFPAGSFQGGPPAIANTRLVLGLFADTLPGFDFAGLGPIGLAHFDADLYSSTKTALDHVGKHLAAGCYVVFDEWHREQHPEAEDHEPRAWREFLETRPELGWTVIGHGAEAWAIQLEE